MYSNTYIIIDATEIFIETPTDLQLQSSTWSNYKHNNTGKVLIGCTPNGAVSFVSDLYVGAISDAELTRVSGLIQKLDGKQNISVMADRGFTIRDQLRDDDQLRDQLCEVMMSLGSWLIAKKKETM